MKELALAGIDTIEAADAFLRDVYLPAYNARFAAPPAEPGSAFVAIPGVDLDEILCVQEERQVGNDNCVSFNRLKLQIPESPLSPTLSRRGSKATSTRTAATPSSSGHGAWAGTTHKERSGT